MNRRKRKGGRTKPCAIPAFKWDLFEKYPSITTLIESLFENHDINRTKMVSTPKAISLNSEHKSIIPYSVDCFGISREMILLLSKWRISVGIPCLPIEIANNHDFSVGEI